MPPAAWPGTLPSAGSRTPPTLAGCPPRHAQRRPRDRPRPAGAARDGAGLPARLDRVRRSCRPSRRRAGRPHLAAVVVDLRLRPRLRGRGRGARRRRVLQPRCLLRRRGRPGPGRGVRRPAQGQALAVRLDRPVRRRLGVRRARGGAGPAHPDRRRRLRLPQPAGLLRRRRLRAARPGRADRAAPARDQARRLLAAAGAAHPGVGRAARRGRGPGHLDRGVRPPRLGPGRSRPALVVHLLAGRARGRRTALPVLRSRAGRPARPAGVRRAGPAVHRPRRRPYRHPPGSARTQGKSRPAAGVRSRTCSPAPVRSPGGEGCPDRARAWRAAA